MSTTIESRDRLIDILSLSYIGDLLREKLGDDAENYTWPDDFEKAVADIGFKGIVYDGGDESSFDLIVIGDALIQYQFYTNASTSLVKSVRFIAFNGASIPAYCFYNNQALTEFICPESVRTIRSNSFYNCRNLSHVWLPKNITIETAAFASCYGLYSVGEEGNGYNLEFEHGLTTFPQFRSAGISEVYVPSGVTSLLDLYECFNLTKVVLPPSVTRIVTFYNCYNLVELTGLDNVVDWSGSVFYGCRSIQEIRLPKGPGFLNSQNIFYNCVSLKVLQLGSVGFPVTVSRNDALTGCTQQDLVITAYVAQDYINTFVANCRNKATHATIVIKAPYQIVYNGTTYAAGDTVLTSTP